MDFLLFFFCQILIVFNIYLIVFSLLLGLFWVGITEPDNENHRNSRTGNYCLYVQLPNTRLGSYWCQIKTVKFRANEILCKIKLLREVATEDLQTNVCKNNFFPTFAGCNNFFLLQRSSISKSLTTASAPDETDDSVTSDIDWTLYLSNLKQSTNEKLYIFFTEYLTFGNIRLVIQFLIFLIISIVTGIAHAIPHIGEYSLRFMREFTYLVQVSTPIVLGIIDMISKIFGGFYILIAMMWRGSTGGNQPPPSQMYRVNAGNYRRPIKYN